MIAGIGEIMIKGLNFEMSFKKCVKNAISTLLSYLKKNVLQSFDIFNKIIETVVS